MPKTEFGVTVQQPDREGSSGAIPGLGALSRTFLATVGTNLAKAPGYWSQARDKWLVDLVKKPGSDLLAGAISTVQAKIVATPWYLEGPETIVRAVRNMLLHDIDFGNGWDIWTSKLAQGYLVRDLGAMTERLRSGPSDHIGPAMGYANLDPSKCSLTGEYQYPVEYYSQDKPVKLHRSQVFRVVDMPDDREEYLSIGYSGASRVISTAMLLALLTKVKREMLSDLPPAGILFIQNMTDGQWQDILDRFTSREENKGNQVWRNFLAAFGLDPAHPVKADWIRFSEFWDDYSDKEATEIAIYSFALGFREDPREFWPVSSGPLGTATEAEIQARKARRKGEGILFAAIERALNHPLSLPQVVRFKFDFQDDEEDKMAAEINAIKSQTIRRLWEPSKTSQNTGGWEAGGERDKKLEEEEEALPSGIITTEEARKWLVMEHVTPPGLLGLETGLVRQYDVKAYGPMVRMTQDGECSALP